MDHVLYGPFTVADAAVVGVFLLFAVWKGYKGLYDCFMPLVVAICAFVGALIVTRLLAGTVTEWLWPKVLEHFSAKVDFSALERAGGADLAAALERALPETLRNLCEKLGVDLHSYLSSALQSAAGGVSQAAGSAAEALLRLVTEKVVRALLFFAAWGVLSLLLTFIKNAAEIVFELPVIHGLNHAGGAVLGLVLCFVLVYAALWAAYLLNWRAALDFAKSSAILQWIAHI